MKKLLLLITVFVVATGSTIAQQTVTGNVSDTQGIPLAGASIVEKGTTNGTQTDFDGNFSLSVSDQNTTLTISYLGFKSQEIQLNGQSNISVSLEDDAAKLDEVVLIGYGTTRKKDLTGAIATINTSDLQNIAPATPDQALQGKVAGVQVRTDSHAPGGGISVQVRGTSSIGASSQPLYVIDGFPISNDFGKETPSGWGAAQNQLNSIDPSNIASIQILKDASATAIYGSRANNGVVLITTKRGSAGSSRLEYDGSFEVRSVSKRLEFLNATEQAMLENEADLLNGNDPRWTSAEIAGMGEGTDWQDVLFRTALVQRHKLSLSGGNEKVRYMASTNLLDQEGLVINTGFQRYGASLNLDANISDKLTMGANMSITGSDNNQTLNDTKGYSTQPSLLSVYLALKPYIPVYDEEGNLAVPRDYKGGGGEDNPLFMATKYDISQKTNRFLGGLNLNYEIIPGLNFRTQVGVDRLSFTDDKYFPIESIVGRNGRGIASQGKQNVTNFLNENTLEYKKEFGNHRLSVLGGFTYQTEKNRILQAEASGFPSDFYSYNNLGLATNPSPPFSSTKEWTLMSYLGRVQYGFNDKYLLTASARYDGSSRFGENNKYGFFPSASAAWVLSEEEFVKNLDVFSQLKVRVGYGQTGNERIGYYRSKPIIESQNNFNVGYVLNDTQIPVAYPLNIANPDLTWEKGSDLNVGLDIGFFDGRLSTTIDMYKKETTDMLLEMPIPIQNGFSNVLVNGGSIENKGIEINISSLNITKNDFTWSSSINFALNRNKVLSLGGGADSYFAGWVGGANQGWNANRVARNAVGEPLGSFWGTMYDGIFRTQEEIDNSAQPNALVGESRWVDLNGDGAINAEDDSYIGDPNPDYIFGINNDFTYKNLSLNIFLYGEQGQDVLNLTWRRMAGFTNPLKSDRDNRFHPVNNPNGTTLAANHGWPARVGTHNVEDGSFVRVRNISLSYKFPNETFAKNIFKSLSLTLAADNPFIFTNYRGYDPEVNSYGSTNDVKGVDRFSYPATKGYRLGIKASF
jgi:TonB-linked SusC/RagA family outer membrane protein